MKYLLIFLLFIITSVYNYPINYPRKFHVNVIGNEEVIKFENKYPEIVKNKKVYIAYLNRYYSDEYVNLLRIRN